MYYNRTISVTENMNDSITEGLGDNSKSSEGLTLQLRFHRTTFEIAFTCVTFTVAFFGFVGNLVTIGKIVRDSKYHTPTFAAIGLLAFADFLSVTFSSFSWLTNIWMLWSYGVEITLISMFSSYIHVCLMSAVRYLITVHPLQSRQHLTVTAVCLCSLTMWIFSGITVTFIRQIQLNIDDSSIVDLLVIIFIPLTVCSIIITLHVKKIRTLRSSMSVTDQAQRRMNIVVTVITSIFVLFNLSLIVNYTLFLIYDYAPSQCLVCQKIYFYYFYVFMGCVNVSCNPYILFLSQFI
ncbi:somatostatin receptor type 5-like [Crassostrea angulata]|uniref:somatostatin receptor type 5-like n=1 Tax=Magallana angulata TaxID=2784310 RepID=UPI0022B0D273|nr:somatostatin receptor type 5-like [Crassostrea angulata]